MRYAVSTISMPTTTGLSLSLSVSLSLSLSLSLSSPLLPACLPPFPSLISRYSLLPPFPRPPGVQVQRGRREAPPSTFVGEGEMGALRVQPGEEDGRDWRQTMFDGPRIPRPTQLETMQQELCLCMLDVPVLSLPPPLCSASFLATKPRKPTVAREIYGASTWCRQSTAPRRQPRGGLLAGSCA